MPYTGNSIVDYLKSVGQSSDYATRVSLAKEKGIQNYSGTAEQNLQLLNTLRTPAQTPVAQPTVQPQPTQQPVVQPNVQPQPVIQPVAQPVQQPKPVVQPTQTQNVLGKYKGVDIIGDPNDQAGIKAQMDRIDMGQTNQPTTQPNQDILNEIQNKINELKPQVEQATKEAQQTQQEQPTEQPTEQPNAQNTNFDDLFAQFGVNTKSNLEDVIKSLSASYGMDTITKEMEDLDSQYADDVMSVNSNPWLSEGLRSKKIGLLQDKYETKKDAYIERLKAQGDIVGQAITLYENEKELQKELLFKSIEMRQQEVENKLAEAKLQETPKGFELSQGQSRYEYNPDTGQFEVVASVAPKASATGTDANDQLYSGLSSATATSVRSKVSQFKSEPIIQNFATIQEGYNFANSIDTNTKNPADDQALIYSLAKALDPGSVVREGEYATAQKYSQSWIKSYGKSIEQALLGTGFLSTTARENIKKTISGKYQSSKQSYENLYSNYKTGINNLTGRSDGDKFITDYITPTPTEPQINSLPPVDNSSEDGGFWDGILNLFK